MIGKSLSKNNIPIRLTKERWSYITKGHPELTGKKEEVLRAIEDPDLIAQGKIEELLAVRRIDDKHIVVVYKEGKKDGFVITSYITSRLKPIKKRGVIWCRPKPKRS